MSVELTSHSPSPHELDDMLEPPVMPAATGSNPPSRPLSEISQNSAHSTHSGNKRHSIATSFRSAKSAKGDRSSRPSSQVLDTAAIPTVAQPNPPVLQPPNNKRRSTSSLAVGTLTVNLVEYAASQRDAPLSSPRVESTPSSPLVPSVPPTPIVKDVPAASQQPPADLGPASQDEDNPSAHPLFVAQRAALRPTPLSPTYAQIARPVLDTSVPAPRSADTPDTVSSSASSTLSPAPLPPLPKSKPSWLSRASGRKTSKGPLSSQPMQPPPLPNRKPSPLSLSNSFPVDSEPSIKEEGENLDLPPTPPSKPSSYASAAAGPSRPRAQVPDMKQSLPPSLSSSFSVRSRLASLNDRFASGSGGMPRSDSTSSFASTATSNRLPSSASRVFGHAKEAKGWAESRMRGFGSISNFQSLQSRFSRVGLSRSDSEDSETSSRGLEKSTRRPGGSRELSREDTGGSAFLDNDVILRRASATSGKVFGRALAEAGRTWGVVDAALERPGESDRDRRRRRALPAVFIRCFEYLETKGCEEEGIFRIPGRATLIAKLKKEFDSGADIDLKNCTFAQIEPHEVAGLMKAYVRELPEGPLTRELEPEFESWQRNKRTPAGLDDAQMAAWQQTREDDLYALTQRLPNANWFILSDLVHLFYLIPLHQSQNRMTFEGMMTSFGHSLQISGNVLAELVGRRERLFATPPPLSVGEEVTQIDFGSHTLTPPSLPAVRLAPILPVRKASLAPSSPAKSVAEAPRPAVSHQRSLSSLLTVGKAINKRASGELLGGTSPSTSVRTSVVDVEPPKLDVPIDSPALPTFGGEKEELVPPASASSLVSALDRGEEVHYASGTVAERSRVFSAGSRTPTPIADRFARDASALPSFRETKTPASSRGHSPSQSIQSAGPWSSKGNSPFFATSAGETERIKHRHSRSLSGPVLESASGMSKLQDNSIGPILGAELGRTDNQKVEGDAQAARVAEGGGA